LNLVNTHFHPLLFCARIVKNFAKAFNVALQGIFCIKVSLGQPSRKLEDFYNTSFKQITNWVHRFEREGLDGLRDKPGRGRRSRLSADQQDRLSKLIMDESPVDYGFNTDTWTGPILIEWIKSQFDIVFKKAQIYNILRKNGFSYQKARGFYPEADLEKQEVFKDTLKKTSSE
jgi:transposase